VVLNQLYKLTQLQDTFGVNMLAIVDGRPEVLPIKNMLEKFVEHRQDVVTRRSVYQLKEAEKRAHILEGLKTALDNIDAIIVLIRGAATPAVAKEGLISQFALSNLQAQAILEMRLQRLTGLERDKIIDELKEVRARIAFLEDILAHVEKLMNVVVEELEDIRTRYGDDRRTEIVDASGEINMEDLIADEMMAVAVTHSGYIKRNSIDTYRAQKRGGKGVTGMATRGEDFLRELFIANTHDHILMFTNTGRVYCKRVYEIPQGSRTARGKAIVNLLDLRKGERVQQMLSVKAIEEGFFVVMATRNGVVKKTKLEDFSNIRTTGIIAIDLEDGDALSEVRLTDGTKQIFLNTRQGMSIRFDESQVRAMGRNARGVRGIGLRENDAMVGMAVLDTDSTSSVVTVCEKGYGKRSSAEEFSSQKRGGLGVIAIKTTDRNGLVVGSRVVGDDDDIMMITASGKVIRMSVEDIRVIGRNTQGVRLIRLDEGERVVSVERLAEPTDDVPEAIAANNEITETPDNNADAPDVMADDATDGGEVESE
jgi:DNA gyrase subunit A